MRHALRLTTTAGGLLALALLAAACSASSSTTQPIGGAETFILTSTSAVADPAYLVTAAGAFAAKGTLAALGAGKSTVKFGDGTFIMARPVAGVHVVVRSLSRRTCAAVLVETGTYTVGSGTGRYIGISGYGTEKARFTAMLPRRGGGKCDTSRTALMLAASPARTIVRGTGTVLIPPHQKG